MFQKSSGTHHVGIGCDFEHTFGSDPLCNYVQPGWPPKAAGLKRSGDQLFIQDYNCIPGLKIDGLKIPRKKWVEITRFDMIEICSTNIKLKQTIFLGKDLVDLESSRLKLVSRNRNKKNLFSKEKILLCDGAYIRAKRGTFTAILGPSGAGKSVFLNMLNGNVRPTQGHISINRQLDLHSDSDIISDSIGYVPQDDLMIPELTPQQALDYRLRLKYPDMKAAIREKWIKGTCRELGFEEKQLAKFLNTDIGSSESGIRGLSGGEKKRANIALELVLNPSVLIIDEPTSGLSYTDSEQIISMLKQLAEEKCLTVIATIHQPSRNVFNKFDDLLILSKGGKMAYYGPSKQAVSFFEKTRGESCGKNQSPPEFLFDFFSDMQECSRSVFCFEKAISDRRTGSKEFPYLYDEWTKPSSPGAGHQGQGTAGRSLGNPLVKGLGQWWILCQRNLKVFQKDNKNLILLIGQAPVIALLIMMAFWGYQNDRAEFNHFARKTYFFGQLKTPMEAQNRSIPIDRLLRQAEKKATTESFLISEFESKKRGAIYFVLVAASVWFGILGGCKEIVTEKHILAREFRSKVYVSPYLCAKWTVLILIVGFQTAFLSLVIAFFQLGLPPFPTLFLWVILWLSASCAAALGLCVSCFSPSYRFALTVVPLLVIAQLVFGGLIRPLTDLEDNTYQHLLAGMTIQRWGFETSLYVDEYHPRGVLHQFVDFNESKQTDRYSELNIVQYEDKSIVSTFFDYDVSTSLTRPLGYLALYSAIFLLISHLRLKRIFR